MEKAPHSRNQEQAYESGAQGFEREANVKRRTYARKAAILAQKFDALADGPARLLEIGAGTGILTELLARRLPHARIHATDAYAGVLDIARERLRDCPRVTMGRLDAYATAAEAGEYDAIFGCDLIHHLEDPVRALESWFRLARPGGRLLFLESNPLNPALSLQMWRRPEEKRFFLNSVHTLTDWAEEAGWADVRVTYLPFYLPNLHASLAPLLGRIEDAFHRGAGPLRRFSGLMLVDGRKPG
jgi:2-polyprenyl-3-methyl-5-hydroxy-6-metoxy-1,4-benzoquinol methylase